MFQAMHTPGQPQLVDKQLMPEVAVAGKERGANLPAIQALHQLMSLCLTFNSPIVKNLPGLTWPNGHQAVNRLKKPISFLLILTTQKKLLLVLKNTIQLLRESSLQIRAGKWAPKIKIASKWH